MELPCPEVLKTLSGRHMSSRGLFGTIARRARSGLARPIADQGSPGVLAGRRHGTAYTRQPADVSPGRVCGMWENPNEVPPRACSFRGCVPQ